MDKQTETLIFLSPTFPADENDNVMTAPENLIKSINKIQPNIKIIILSFHYPLGKKCYEWNGNRVYTFNGRMRGGIHSLLLWMKVWKSLNRLKKENNILGIFSFFCSESAFIGQLFSRVYRLKHFIWILGQDAKKNNKQVSRMKPKPENLIAISDFTSDCFFQNHNIKPRHIIPSGIIEDQFTPISPKRNIDILGAGSLILLKQYNLFIKVASVLIKTYPDLKIELIGNGPEQTNLINQINDLGLKRNIELDGQKKPHKETLAKMQKAKIFLHPSSFEGFSTVCMEALYAGCHVISFCKPMLENFPHWHYVENIDEMIKTTEKILSDSKTEYSNVPTYLMDDSAKKILQLYQS